MILPQKTVSITISTNTNELKIIIKVEQTQTIDTHRPIFRPMF